MQQTLSICLPQEGGLCNVREGGSDDFETSEWVTQKLKKTTQFLKGFRAKWVNMLF